MTKTTRRAALALTALLLVVSACGSDDGGAASTDASTDATTATTAASADSSAAETTNAPATGEPVKVMLLSQLEAPGFAFPEIEPITKATIDQFNKTGGVNGRPVDLVVCNDQNDSNVAAGCARDAVSQGVVAVLGYFSFAGNAVLPILEQAGIPYVGNSILSISDAGSKAAFPLEGGIVSIGADTGRALVEAGCKGVGAVGDGSIAASLYSNNAKTGVEKSGGTWSGDVQTTVGTPDYGPAVASLVSKGADCIHVPLPPAESAKLLGAILQSGHKVTVGSGSANIPQAVIEALPAAATEGTIIVTPLPVPSDVDFPGVQDYIDAMTKAGVSDDVINAGFSISSYAKTVVALNAMSTITGDITAASMTQAMSSITDPGTPLLGDFSTTQESSIPGFPRIFNFAVLEYKVEGQKLVRLTDTYVDTADLLQPAG
jgi:ABC-type branched-subunit amino acid transport system substrate-binding protein